MKKTVVLLATCFSIFNLNAQLCQYLGPDQYLPCGTSTTTITADFSQCNSNPIPPPKETNTYLVQNIPFTPSPATGTQVFLSDDAVSGALPIGFSFCFFGNTYNQIYIGSNGWISFSAGQPATFTSVPIPNAGFNVPKNCIMGPWQDWHPGIGGQIRYQTQGTAPCRRLVVSFTSVPLFSCTGSLGTFQIVLYEGTNIIENHITNKPSCTQWAGGTAVQGIQNLAGNTAFTVPGRNSTAWTTTNNAWRYTPNGNNVTPTITWFQVGNPTPIATNVTSITVTPPSGGAFYTATFTYSGCFANYAACGGGGGIQQDTVFVQPMMNQTVQLAPFQSYCAGSNIPPFPTTSSNGITGAWSPIINNNVTTTYTFTPNPGQCANPVTQTLTIVPGTTSTFNVVPSYCFGSTIPNLPTTSLNGYTGVWSPAINNTATTTYTFTPDASECAISTTLTIVINPQILPTFNQVGPYCSGAAIPALPANSQNGISGTWSPAINNTATTTYTFTPNAGECATTNTITITITAQITPAFNAVGPYCSGAAIPPLPTTSINGFTGVWSPAINNLASSTYTFTPTVGQCATSTTLTITINPNITPTFAAVGPYCSGAVIPALPTTSQNGFTGTWSPAINNLATSTYTFTPTVGQCATSATLTITINPNITPTFAAVGPYCSGAVIPALPTTSQNGFTGTWSPAINNLATSTYTFTPTVGQCATTATLTITINPNITPTFAAVGPYCSGAVIPTLPTTSQNGFTGTWAPAINNTSTTTYTFTPTAGQCATSTTLTITINPNITPTFAAVGPYCSGAVIPALPTTSINGFTGVWSPAINNTTTTNYTFVPSSGQCATTATITIVINPNITPTFAPVGPYCTGTSIPNLPTTSQNGYNGNWSPAINNTTTTTYTFTPSVGQCASQASTIIIIDPAITPVFNPIGPFCQGAPIPAFPSQSVNGFSGTWAPAPNNSQTTTYTFTSALGQCALNTTQTVNITPVVPSVTNVSVCQNSLPYLWNGQTINAAGQFQASISSPSGCDSLALLNLTLLPTLSSTTNIQICENAIPYYWNGLALTTSGTTTLTLSSVQDCDSLATLNLTVSPMPQVAFTANIAEGCAPVQVTFTSSTSNSGATCQWNLGNGVTINNCGSISGTYNSFGCYDVSLQITSSAGCVSSLTQEDIVCVNPQPSASFVVSPQVLSNYNTTATFTNTSIGQVTQLWNFGDGSGTSTILSPNYTYPEEAGYYNVTLIVANSHGCIDSTSQVVFVENNMIYYVPNTFTPDGDLFNETFKPIFTAGFDIYQYNLIIFNRWGEIIFESNDAEIGWDGTYGGKACQDGTYIWQVTYKELGKDKRNELRGHFNLVK